MKMINLLHTLSSRGFCLCMCTNKWGFFCSFVFSILSVKSLKYDVTGIIIANPTILICTNELKLLVFVLGYY